MNGAEIEAKVRHLITTSQATLWGISIDVGQPESVERAVTWFMKLCKELEIVRGDSASPSEPRAGREGPQVGDDLRTLPPPTLALMQPGKPYVMTYTKDSGSGELLAVLVEISLH